MTGVKQVTPGSEPASRTRVVAELLKKTVPPLIGLVAGVRIVTLALQAVEAPGTLHRLWALVAISLTTVAGVVFSYGMSTWKTLPTGAGAQLSAVVPTALLYASAGVAASTAGSLLLTESPSNRWVAPALLAVAILGAFPAVCVAVAVRQAARHFRPAETSLDAALTLIKLRRILWRLLGAGGALVVLITLALSVSVKARSEQAPGEQGTIAVLMTGGFGSLAVAAVYVPSAAALRHRGEELCDRVLAKDKADNLATLTESLERYHKLAQLLAVDRTTFADLEAGMVILGPLMAAGLSTFLRA